MADVMRPPLTFAFFPEVARFEVTSTDFQDGGTLGPSQVADSMGYSGENNSPQLSWSGAPTGTKSFAVTIHDPDAPTGSGFWHWVVVNIPADVSSVESGAGSLDRPGLFSPSLQLRNDAGFSGYMGAAPPPGELAHRYVHTVHAVDVAHLEIDPQAAPAIAGFNLRFHAIGRAQIVGTFGS